MNICSPRESTSTIFQLFASFLLPGLSSGSDELLPMVLQEPPDWYPFTNTLCPPTNFRNGSGYLLKRLTRPWKRPLHLSRIFLWPFIHPPSICWVPTHTINQCLKTYSVASGEIKTNITFSLYLWNSHSSLII